MSNVRSINGGKPLQRQQTEPTPEQLQDGYNKAYALYMDCLNNGTKYLQRIDFDLLVPMLQEAAQMESNTPKEMLMLKDIEQVAEAARKYVGKVKKFTR